MKEFPNFNDFGVDDDDEMTTTEETAAEPAGPKDLLYHLSEAARMGRKSQLSAKYFEDAAEHLDYIAGKLELTVNQAAIFSAFADRAHDWNITINEIRCDFGCRGAAFMRYLDDVNALLKRWLIRRNEDNYFIPNVVKQALRADANYRREVPVARSCSDLFYHIKDVTLRVNVRNSEDYLNIREEMESLLEVNKEQKFVRELKAIGLTDPDDEFMLIDVCHNIVNRHNYTYGKQQIQDIFHRHLAHEKFYDLTEGLSSLLLHNILEPANEDGLRVEGEFSLTEEYRELLLGELPLGKPQDRPRSTDIIVPESIVGKQMYYNPAEAYNIDQLKGLLMPEHYGDIRDRMKESGMRCAFTILLHGAPGTGKTETSLQLAKSTGRTIFQVDISQIRGMWVGESEKNVKQIFDRYRNMVKSEKETPILLLNEADALLGVRMNGAEHSVDKMNNSMQNIFLQEMENLDGILIATTNLTDNLDGAFDRRFLYKVEFKRPSVEAKASIWLSMIPSLTAEEAAELSRTYDFSGGQIENVARKFTIHHILHGDSKPAIEIIHELSASEDLRKSSTRSRIGF